MQIQLAWATGTWPTWAREIPSFAPYAAPERIAARATLSGDIIKQYIGTRPDWHPDWRTFADKALRELEATSAVDILDATHQHITHHLAHILITPPPSRKNAANRSAYTRNHALKIIRQFFKWCVSSNLIDTNPTDGIKKIRAKKQKTKIVYLDEAERDTVAEAARQDPDGLAVLIALYAGMRRAEIIRLEWEDVDWKRGLFCIHARKTESAREIPIHKKLLSELKKTPKSKRRGPVVIPNGGDEAERTNASDALIKRLKKLLPDMDSSLVAWLVFRHTFGSLLVQRGKSVDQVASWLGDSPKVCMDHYAQFTPKSRRDDSIDLL